MQHLGILLLSSDTEAELAKHTVFLTGCHNLTFLLSKAKSHRCLLILGRGTQGPLHYLTRERNKGTCETESRMGFLSCPKTKGEEEGLMPRLPQRQEAEERYCLIPVSGEPALEHLSYWTEVSLLQCTPARDKRPL